MARLLVVGSDDGLARREALARLAARIEDDGHAVATLADEPVRQLRDADAVVALLDGAPAEVIAVLAVAMSLEKPCLGLESQAHRIPTFVARGLTTRVRADTEGEWHAALLPFYDEVRPFAGRLVRDRIPALVAEAGHELRFRELEPGERARFLKHKVAEEAAALRDVQLPDEREEIADVLEALEGFIHARGYDRDDLRRVKQQKLERRGGFERGYVVEATPDHRGGAATVGESAATGAAPRPPVKQEAHPGERPEGPPAKVPPRQEGDQRPASPATVGGAKAIPTPEAGGDPGTTDDKPAEAVHPFAQSLLDLAARAKEVTGPSELAQEPKRESELHEV